MKNTDEQMNLRHILNKTFFCWVIFHEDVVIFVHFYWLQKIRNSCDESWRLVLKKRNAKYDVFIHDNRKLFLFRESGENNDEKPRLSNLTEVHREMFCNPAQL